MVRHSILLETVLSRLGDYKEAGNGFKALCPAHEDSNASLSVTEAKDGRVLLNCFAGCTCEQVVQALDLEMKDLFPVDRREEAPVPHSRRVRPGRSTTTPANQPRVTVVNLAGDKGLDPAWLESLGVRDRPSSGVVIPYYNAAGQEIATRFRTALKAKDGSSWPKGTRLVAYGEDRLGLARERGYLVLVEGESDAWTLWKHGFPCLGIPGATNTVTLEIHHLEGVECLYVCQEPDTGGDTFVHRVGERVRHLGYNGQVLIVRLDAKDANDLHKLNSTAFPAEFQAALERAVPFVTDPEEEADPYAFWESESGYLVEGATTYRIEWDRNGQTRKRLANFAARVVEQTALDDGDDVQRFYTIEGRMHNGRSLGRQRVPIAKFTAMNWPTEVWGFGPSITAGMGTKDRVRAAIEEFSGSEVRDRQVFTYLGWRETERGPCFLNAGGAVGLEGVEVDLDTDLQKYHLPHVQTRTASELQQALRASLSFLELGDPRVTFPLWAAVYRAPLCQFLRVNFMLWCLGESGSFKTTTSALALNHFGEGFNKDTLPGSWLDTENRLEQRAFLAKDVMLVVDDFCPEKHAGLAAELDRKAARFIRAVGNNQGRGRMTAEATARKTFYPRGLVVSTAEQLPNLAPSNLARLLPVPFQKGRIDPHKLTALQQQYFLLPHAVAGYLEYLLPRVQGMGDSLRKRFVELRTKAQVDGHARLPETVAHLYLGLESGIGYLTEMGIVSNERASELLAQGWQVFMGLASDHARILVEERPTLVFLHVLQEALSSGRAWLADRKSGHCVAGVAGGASEKLGWIDEKGIYLLPKLAYSFASERLRARGGTVLSDRALKTMLQDDGYLLVQEANRLEAQHRCEGLQKRVLWLRPNALGEVTRTADSYEDLDSQKALWGDEG